MTATATAAVLPAAAPRANPTPEPRDTAEPGKFDRQLDAARQKQASPQADQKQQAPAGDRSASDTKDPSTQASAGSTAPAKAAGENATTARDTDDDAPADGETPASALAGAMLAMLGPANAVLRPLTTGVGAVQTGAIGKGTAADTSAAALLKMNSAATDGTANAATNLTALPAGAGIMLAANETRFASVDKPADTAAQPTAALAPPSTGTQAAPTVHQLQISTPAGSHGFAQELGQQVAWLGGQDVKQARIRLHPEELGQLDIKVSVNHGRVDVVFNAQHPGAVAVVQQSLPQLDQMLGQHGLSLGHADVGQHDRGDRNGSERQSAGGAGIDEVGEIHAVAASSGTVGLLDAFA